MGAFDAPVIRVNVGSFELWTEENPGEVDCMTSMSTPEVDVKFDNNE